jgi:integrase
MLSRGNGDGSSPAANQGKVTSKGRTYYYAWRGGPRLKSAPGTPEFVDELAAAQGARKQGDKSRISGLCAQWRASDFWQLPPEAGGIAHSTRKNWAPWLDRIEEHFGTLRIAQFERPDIRKDIKRWRDKWKRTPRAADMAKQVLSALLSFAVDDGCLGSNPCIGIKNLYTSNRSEIIWTDEDISNLEANASPEIVWALKLACLTGLRQSDLLRLSWSHVGDLSIEITTGKSKHKRTAVIPIYAELRALLAEIPKRATTVLTNQDGQPWKSGFGSSWNKALKAAGETRLHFHDARGTTATKLHLADFKTREIAEQLAWSEDQVERIINRYVRKNALLLDRISRLDANALATQAVKQAVKPPG